MFPSWSGSAFKDWYALKCKCQCVGFIDRKCQRTSFSTFRRRGIFLKLVDRCAQMWNMLRAISLLQIIYFFSHIRPLPVFRSVHWTAPFSSVLAVMEVTSFQRRDKRSEWSEWGSRFLKMAGTDSHISAPCLFVFWLRKVLFASLDRVRTDFYRSHINLFNRQETVVETFFKKTFNTTCSCS